MNIHEYQARDLLRRFELPVPPHAVAATADDAVAAASDFGFAVVLKAQVLAGGRGKAGGSSTVMPKQMVSSLRNRLRSSGVGVQGSS